MDIETEDSPIQEINDELCEERNVRFFLKREDLLDPVISGNKYRKLKYNLLEAKAQGKKMLLTFGGAYSNHIHAVAYAGKKFGFETVGIIRGERVEPLNATLRDAESWGMKFEFLSREEYKNKNAHAFISTLREKWGDFLLLPEGGSNVLAVKGCEEIVNPMESGYDYVCCCCGTGGTLAGIICGMDGKGQILGFPALKGGDFLEEDIQKLTLERSGKSYSNWRLMTDYHFDGYAKFQPQLITFINSFKEKHFVALDPVYTGKMLFGIFDLIQKDFFERGSGILVIHTGGLQGIRGFNERFGPLIK